MRNSLKYARFTRISQEGVYISSFVFTDLPLKEMVSFPAGHKMIRKFLVISNRVSFSSSKFEEEEANTYTVDLLLPLKKYWYINQLLNKADFLLASHEQLTDIQDIYKLIFKESAPYALSENDRIWLYKKSNK